MSRIRFDQLAKQYLEDFLEPLGTVQRNLEVPGEPKFVDLWFTPSPTRSPSQDLGLLSRIASTPCLLEPFRNAPTHNEAKTCVLKLLWLQEDQRRKLENAGQKQTEQSLPKLWILAATTTHSLITAAQGTLQAAWGDGIYHLAELFNTAIVVIDRLPTTPDTLWLRILGRDQVQQQAIAELLALPRSDPRRDRVLELLANWNVTIGLSDLNLTTDEERGLMVQLSPAYLEWKQARIQEGRLEGRLEGEIRTVLRLLDRRFGTLSDDRRAQIQCLSQAQIDHLADSLLDFATDADLTIWLQTLHDRLALVNDRLQRQWHDLPPNLQTQVQHLSPSHLATLLETLPQLTSQDDLRNWLQTQHLAD